MKRKPIPARREELLGRYGLEGALLLPIPSTSDVEHASSQQLDKIHQFFQEYSFALNDINWHPPEAMSALEYQVFLLRESKDLFRGRLRKFMEYWNIGFNWLREQYPDEFPTPDVFIVPPATVRGLLDGDMLSLFTFLPSDESLDPVVVMNITYVTEVLGFWKAAAFRIPKYSEYLSSLGVAGNPIVSGSVRSKVILDAIEQGYHTIQFNRLRAQGIDPSTVDLEVLRREIPIVIGDAVPQLGLDFRLRFE